MWIIQYKEVGSDEWFNLSTKVFTVLAPAKAYVEAKKRRYGFEYDYRLLECKVLED